MRDSHLPLILAKARTQAFLTWRSGVYMLASDRNRTLYLGHTDDLWRRVTAHKAHALPGFTAKYDVTCLVWYEAHESREQAFTRERRMKVWRRAWKIELIERFNLGWRDLFEDFQP